MQDRVPQRAWSRADLASFYGVSTRTIDRWQREGLIPGPDLLISSRTADHFRLHRD